MRLGDIEAVDAPTEARNPRTVDIDRLGTLELLRALNAEDRLVPEAVAAALPILAQVVDATAARLGAGGRLHYFGAGTSGRVAIMDAAELVPTFGLDPSTVVAHHAGGPEALYRPAESVEDDADLGALDAAGVTGADVALGLTASGRTPYVAGALRTSHEAGAVTVLVSSNPAAPLARLADYHVLVDTGPEAIAGSTRLKAATAQKLVLNSLSTAVMIRCGKTWSNLMVDMAATNSKLRGRVLTILAEASGRADADCISALSAAEGDLKVALVCLLADTSPAQARATLAAHEGNVRAAVASLDGSAG